MASASLHLPPLYDLASEGLSPTLFRGTAVTRVASAALTRDNFAVFVAQNRPLLITGTSRAGWPEAALDAAADANVTVCFTPHGFGDALITVVADDEDAGGGVPLMAQPQERVMPLGAALSLLRRRDESLGVPYISFQNDSLRREVPALLAAAPPLPWSPWPRERAEAVNLWIGDERAVSSCHKDHYENLYTVLAGEKVFTLAPPADALFLRERSAALARYRLAADGAAWHVDWCSSSSSGGGDSGGAAATELAAASGAAVTGCRCEASAAAGGGDARGQWRWRAAAGTELRRAATTALRVPWIATDPRDIMASTAAAAAAPPPPLPPSLYARCGAPIEVRVAAGETLYLPAWWYHSVTQSELTIAINEWHNADFGSPAFSLLSVARALAPAVEESWGTAGRQ